MQGSILIEILVHTFSNAFKMVLFLIKPWNLIIIIAKLLFFLIKKHFLNLKSTVLVYCE